MFIYYAILILVVFLLEILSIIRSELLSAVNHFSQKKKNQIVPLNVTTMFRLDNVTHYPYHMPTTKDP